MLHDEISSCLLQVIPQESMKLFFITWSDCNQKHIVFDELIQIINRLREWMSPSMNRKVGKEVISIKTLEMNMATGA